MCISHFEAASLKGTVEKLVGTIGVIIGIIAGIIAMIILMMRWESPESTNIILRLLLGGVFGLGVFVMVWAVFALWLAPIFAEPASREAREAVRITRVSPEGNILQLEFRNEQLAEIVQKQNQFS